jgi:multicomponent Na+:H+ antiporter subunit B
MRELLRITIAFGTAFALAAGLYAVHGFLTPGGAVIGSMLVAAGVVPSLFTPGSGAASMRFRGKPLRKTEILGLLIFILMAAIMLAVGTALFYAWLAGSGPAPAGIPVDLGSIGGLSVAGTIPTMALVFGVEVIGGLSLIVLYMLSSVWRRG